jgi:Tol biopolymer transport system component
MLRGRTLAAAATVGVLCEPLSSLPGFVWLTVPQSDGRRAQTSAASARVSASGRYVAFTSYARLSADDVDTLADIYVLDRSTTTVSLESASVERRPLRSDCSHPAISADGRYVVFEAVVTDDSGRRVTDIVLRDRQADTSRWITIGAAGGLSNGWNAEAVIAANGSAVVFTSTATNLTAGPDVNGTQADIYRFDVATSLIDRISVDSGGAQQTGGSLMPSVSADGRYVAFSSTADLSNLRQGQQQSPTRGRRQVIYLRDTRMRQTMLVGRASELPNDASTMPVVSADGRSVAFSSRASNLVARDRNKSFDVFLYDVDTAAVTLVSRGSAGGTANGASLGPAISADGRVVAFQSDASDMACARDCPPGMDDINLLPDVFVFDRTTGQISCVSLDHRGAWMEESGGPSIDASGAVVAFTSRHPISARDVLNDFDLFVRIAGQ